jgi:hypothetical protein
MYKKATMVAISPEEMANIPPGPRAASNAPPRTGPITWPMFHWSPSRLKARARRRSGTSWWMVDQYAGEEKVPTVPSQTANTIRAKGDRAPPKARRARATMPRR